MKVFHCNKCQQPIYFQNSVCVSCGSTLAYLPDIADMTALEPVGDGHWRPVSGPAASAVYTLCKNYSEQAVCNWAIGPSESVPYCHACRLTAVIPNLAIPGNLEAWRALELAKRRLIYTLDKLGFLVTNREDDPEDGVAYEFLSDTGPTPEERAFTGHDNGVITINVAEADDVERERRRKTLHEPYRTLLGHFRHEVGHYYWNLLMRDPTRLAGFRKLFGNEHLDYGEALEAHYKNGADPEWQSSYVSAYASSHPWEDWAETWAHYLHMSDALETAADSGLRIPARPTPGSRNQAATDFDAMIEDWLTLASVLNNLSRSQGQSDAYPFVLAPAVIEKLRFVHSCVPKPLNVRARIAVNAQPELPDR